MAKIIHKMVCGCFLESGKPALRKTFGYSLQMSARLQNRSERFFDTILRS